MKFSESSQLIHTSRASLYEAVYSDVNTKKDPETKNSAAQRFSDTFELLEMVLLNLPLRNLFTIQRTTRSFRDTVANSLKLRRRMFLEPESSGVGSAEALNPLLNAEPVRLRPFDPRCICAFWRETHGSATPPLLEPDPAGTYPYLQFQRGEQFLNVPYVLKDEWVGDESWTKMRAMQHVQGPVTARLGADILWGAHLDDDNVLGEDSTMGELFDWVQQQD